MIAIPYALTWDRSHLNSLSQPDVKPGRGARDAARSSRTARSRRLRLRPLRLGVTRPAIRSRTKAPRPGLR